MNDRVTLVLHAGAHKTGTTSIQGALSNSSVELQECGILYPALPFWEHNHTGLTAGLVQSDRDMGRLVRAKLSAMGLSREEFYSNQIDSIRLQIAKAQPRVVVLSSEAFFNSQRYNVPRLVQDLGLRLDQVKVLIYLREPPGHYLSLLQQSLKHSTRFKDPSSIKFSRTVGDYQEWFGESVRVRPIEGLSDGVISDIAEYLSCAQGVLGDVQRKNVSLSAESMSILQRFRLSAHPAKDDIVVPDCNRLFRSLRRAEGIVGYSRPTLLDSVVRTVWSSCEGELGWLFARFPEFEEVWGPDVLSGSDWKRPDRQLLVEDVCVVNQGVCSNLLMEVLLREWKFIGLGEGRRYDVG